MKSIESGNMREYGERAKEILRLHPDIDREGRKYLEIQKKQAEVHAMVESRAGIRLDTVVEGGPKNAAAFVSKSNIESGRKKAAINIATLQHAEHALHAGIHEAWHIKSRFTAIELEQELFPEQLQKLQAELGIQELDQTFWLEGFNELATIRDVGKDSNCAYNAEEVPAAEQLENLCMRHTGESLLAAYRSADKLTFYSRLRKLCDLLLAEEISANLMQKAA